MIVDAAPSTGSVIIFPLFSSLIILTPVEVPIPTDKFGSTLNLILSPIFKSWFVLTWTVPSIFCTEPFTVARPTVVNE